MPPVSRQALTGPGDFGFRTITLIWPDHVANYRASPMGKATGVGSIIFGLVMIFVGIGAFFSEEESSQTQSGKMAIGIVIILGLALIYGGVSARQKADEKAKAAQQAQAAQTAEPLPPPPPPDATPEATCPHCGREIRADFVACPFCGKPVKSTCPKCGKQVQSDFVACPYCGVQLAGSRQQ